MHRFVDATGAEHVLDFAQDHTREALKALRAAHTSAKMQTRGLKSADAAQFAKALKAAAEAVEGLTYQVREKKDERVALEARGHRRRPARRARQGGRHPAVALAGAGRGGAAHRPAAPAAQRRGPMFCAKCGEDYPDGLSACPRCFPGAPKPGPAAAAPAPLQVAQAAAVAGAGSSGAVTLAVAFLLWHPLRLLLRLSGWGADAPGSTWGLVTLVATAGLALWVFPRVRARRPVAVGYLVALAAGAAAFDLVRTVLVLVEGGGAGAVLLALTAVGISLAFAGWALFRPALRSALGGSGPDQAPPAPSR
ncbi:MAG: hypothetical protein QM765_43090 [Myxococcales bacterium]